MNNYRKHILTAVFCAMLLFYGGEWLIDMALQGPIEAREKRSALLKKRLTSLKREGTRIVRARRTLKVWQAQSLPSDTEVARSLYRAWLLELVDHVGLSSPSVESGEPLSRKGAYYLLPFTVRARGDLEQLTKFLFEFYNAGHLHQLGSLGITPIPNSDQLDLSITVEALTIRGADRKDRLTTGRSGRLASTALDDYRVIVVRNLFAAGGIPEDVDHAYLEGIVSVDGRPQAWFGLRTTGEKLKLSEGDLLEIGGFRATVVEIAGDDRDVVLDAKGQRWLLSLGEKLTDAWALPPEF